MVGNMRNAIRTALGCEAGQSLVELCLAVPFLFLVMVGAAELSRIAYYSIVVENAAHSAALFAAQDTVAASDGTDITTVADREATSIGGSSVLQTPSVTHSCTCVTAGTNTSMASCTGATGGLTACPAPGTILQYVTVNTQATANTLFHYPGLAGNTFTVYGSATMAVAQ